MDTNYIYDVIVIGAGHNGLTAAAYLGKAGKKVLVLEKRTVLGGAAATEEVFPGFRINTGAWDAGQFLPRILSDLRLEEQGLRFMESPAIVTTFQSDGRPLTIWRDPQRTIEELEQHSPVDARRYADYVHWVRRLTNILSEVLTLTPPQIPDLTLSSLIPWLKPALQARRLGKRDVMEFVRLLPMPVNDFLDEWFVSSSLKAALALPAISGTFAGPRASGTVFTLLYHALGAGAARYIQGGIGRLSDTLGALVQKQGGEIRTGAGVSNLILEGEGVRGVVLQSGEQLAARVVLSNADPRQTFFQFVGAEHLPVSFVREVKNIRFRASLSRVNLALESIPMFSGFTSESEDDIRSRLSGQILICPDLDAIERAYDDAKYGQLSQQPVLDMVLPTLLDNSLAPAGKHILGVNVHYTPFQLKDGDWNSQRSVLLARVMGVLKEQIADLAQQVIHSQVITPADLQSEYSLPNGDINHGQMALDQLLFMRPAAGYGQYSTPIENLFLCGAGTHPGGGVTGAPGYNAARAVLKYL